jgi:hypothetical protein
VTPICNDTAVPHFDVPRMTARRLARRTVPWLAIRAVGGLCPAVLGGAFWMTPADLAAGAVVAAALLVALASMALLRTAPVRRDRRTTGRCSIVDGDGQ